MNKKIISCIISFSLILSLCSVFADKVPPCKIYEDRYEAQYDERVIAYAVSYAKSNMRNQTAGMSDAQIEEFALNDETCMAYGIKKVEWYNKSYTPGETEHIVNGADFIASESSGATLSGSSVQINAGGSARFGFFVPYSTRSVTIVYTGGGNITLKTEQDEYNSVLLTNATDEATHKIEFGINLGRGTDDESTQYRTWTHGYGTVREYVEHGGEKKVTVTSDSPITIKELRFEKELTMGANESVIPEFSTDPDIQRYETELMSTVLIHEDAPIIVVNGGRRYIDNGDIHKKPYARQGSIYLPVNTLSKALGYYSEVMNDKVYALMRSDSHEVVLMGSTIKVMKGMAVPQTASAPAFIYDEGEILASVRYFAELCGKTVDYKDGLVVIDDKYTTRDVLNDTGFYNYAKAKFAQFVKAPTIGNTYYVAENGHYANSGTEQSPWTLSKASKQAKPGDTVILKAGTYRETLVPQNSGTANAPITYKAADGERVIISAADKVSNNPSPYKTVNGKTIYRFDVSNIEDLGIGRNQIYINGEMQPEARYPDGPAPADGLSNAWPVRGDIFKSAGVDEATADYNTMYSDTLLNQEDGYWNGGIYVGTFGLSYAVLTGKIASSTKGKLIIDDTYRTDRWWKKSCEEVNRGSDQWNYGMIVGHMNALNMPGEWVREGNKLYIILPEGSSAATVKIEEKARQIAIDLTDKSFINIEGIETFGGGITMDNSEMCMLKDINMKYISHYTLNSDPSDGYIDFPFNHTAPGAPQRGEVGVYVGGRDNIIVNSRIDHSASAGIYATGLYGYFENNIINDTGYMGSYASGIYLHTIPWEQTKVPRGGYGIYNNTVYNTGRGAICYARNGFTSNNETGTSIQHPGFISIGSDIAYNDFHDACLITEDAGAVYSNGVIGGFDKKLTTFRNNYIYKTLTGEDTNPGDALLYWDGDAHNFDSYNNLLFSTGDMVAMMQSIAYVEGSEAYDRLWNNQILGSLTLDSSKPVADALGNEYFSEDRPFFAGSDLDRAEPYMNNYERFEDGNYTMQYEAKDAELSSGVTISLNDGYATFTGDGQYIDFKNVNFGDGANEMVISYFCDSNWTFDDFEITVYDGEDVAGGKTFKTTAPQQDVPTKNKACTMRFMIDPISGTKNVRVKVTDYFSARIGGISVYKRTKLERTDAFSLFAYPLENPDKISGQQMFMFESKLTSDNPHTASVAQLWQNHIFRYDDRTITADSDYFIIAAGTGSIPRHRKQLVRVYLCDANEPRLNSRNEISRNAELVAEFRILKQHDRDTEPIKVPIINEAGKVTAGTYDIYFDFVGESENRASTMRYFGFLKEGADTSEFITQARYQGGKYDKSISSPQGELPFSVELLSFDDMSRKKLLNTLPGSTAGYSDIDVLYDTNKLTIGYWATDEYDGQNVTVRVENADNAEVARGTFTTSVNDGKFTGKEITLDRTVFAGNYKVYFDFGGSGDMTCQLGWFKFGD